MVLSGCKQHADGETAAVQQPPVAVQAKAPVVESVSPATGLAGTRWRLRSFQSMDDAVGTLWTDDPNKYLLALNADGSATLLLNCNRANGSWKSEAGASGQSGTFQLDALTATKALCPPPSMDAQILAQSQYIRGYLRKDGKLYLSLMADGGIYEWEPQAAAESAAVQPRL